MKRICFYPFYPQVGCKDGSLKLDDLNSEKSYEPWKVYQQSKMCNVLFTLELAKRLANTGVTVNALHPGIIRTELVRNYREAYNWSKALFGLIMALGYPFQLWFMKSAKQGAQTQIYCAVSEELDNVSGKYFSDCKERALLPEILDEKLAEELWSKSAKLVNLDA